jgi:hypothetical protein
MEELHVDQRIQHVLTAGLVDPAKPLRWAAFKRSPGISRNSARSRSIVRRMTTSCCTSRAVQLALGLQPILDIVAVFAPAGEKQLEGATGDLRLRDSRRLRRSAPWRLVVCRNELLRLGRSLPHSFIPI